VHHAGRVTLRRSHARGRSAVGRGAGTAAVGRCPVAGSRASPAAGSLAVPAVPRQPHGRLVGLPRADAGRCFAPPGLHPRGARRRCCPVRARCAASLRRAGGPAGRPATSGPYARCPPPPRPRRPRGVRPSTGTVWRRPRPSAAQARALRLERALTLVPSIVLKSGWGGRGAPVIAGCAVDPTRRAYAARNRRGSVAGPPDYSPGRRVGTAAGAAAPATARLTGMPPARDRDRLPARELLGVLLVMAVFIAVGITFALFG